MTRLREMTRPEIARTRLPTVDEADARQGSPEGEKPRRERLSRWAPRTRRRQLSRAESWSQRQRLPRASFAATGMKATSTCSRVDGSRARHSLRRVW